MKVNNNNNNNKFKSIQMHGKMYLKLRYIKFNLILKKSKR